MVCGFMVCERIFPPSVLKWRRLYSESETLNSSPRPFRGFPNLALVHEAH